MSEMHLRQSGFTFNDCRPFTNNKEQIQKFKETRDSRYIYSNGLDKACFQHDITYGDFKDFAKKNQLLIKLDVIKHFILLKMENVIDTKDQKILAPLIYNCFN